MTTPTRTFWRQAAARGAILLVTAAGVLTLWYRATYHMWPGMGVPPAVHWCGRDYQLGAPGPQTWAQITAQAPAAIRAVGSYPPFGPGHPLLASTGRATHPRPGQVCAMAVYLRTGPGRYQAYTLEGGP
jgi:hypothetical protein